MEKRNAIMIESFGNTEILQALTNEELGNIIGACEEAIEDGTAEIDHYEAFVLCQKELVRRTWA